MKALKKGMLTAALAMVFTLACALSAFADTAYVTTSDGGSVNMRAEASTDADVVNFLADGTEVEVLGTDGDWTQVSYDGYTGYVMSTYLTTTSSDTTDTDADTADTATDTDTTTEDADGTVTVGSITYTIADTIPDGILPSDFTEINIEYNNAGYGGAANSTMGIDVLYLESDSYSGLFIYDSSDDSFLPYLSAGSDEHYVVVLEIPSGFALPEGYEIVTISADSTGLLTAYQETDPALDDTDLYIVYGVNNAGTETWYIIDTAESTYIRTAQPTAITTDEEETADSSDAASDSSDVTTYKRYLMLALIAVLILVIIIVNLLLFYRRGEYVDDEEEYDDDDEEDDDEDTDDDPYGFSEVLGTTAEPQKHRSVPQETRRVDVPDISKLIDDTTAEAYDDTVSGAAQPTRSARTVTPQAPVQEDAPDPDDELEFFDLDDL